MARPPAVFHPILRHSQTGALLTSRILELVVRSGSSSMFMRGQLRPRHACSTLLSACCGFLSRTWLHLSRRSGRSWWGVPAAPWDHLVAWILYKQNESLAATDAGLHLVELRLRVQHWSQDVKERVFRPTHSVKFHNYLLNGNAR